MHAKRAPLFHSMMKTPFYSFDVPNGSAVLVGGAKFGSRSTGGFSVVSDVPGTARLLFIKAPGSEE